MALLFQILVYPFPFVKSGEQTFRASEAMADEAGYEIKARQALRRRLQRTAREILPGEAVHRCGVYQKWSRDEGGGVPVKVGEHGALSLGSAFEGVGAERQGAESLDINKRQGTAVSQRSHVSQMSHHSRASRASTRHSDLSWRSTDSLNSSMILERSCFEPCRVANPCHQTSPAFLPPLAP